MQTWQPKQNKLDVVSEMDHAALQKGSRFDYLTARRQMGYSVVVVDRFIERMVRNGKFR